MQEVDTINIWYSKHTKWNVCVLIPNGTEFDFSRERNSFDTYEEAILWVMRHYKGRK